ncbi:MAG: hypothetical protein RIC16_03490 [Rhodospirillales bacterium]
MVISLNQNLQDSLSNLLTSTQSQARNVAFNIQFAALQDTVIRRLNAEIVEVENITGRQSQLNRIQQVTDQLNDRRAQVSEFEFLNTSNNQRFSTISTLATNASIALELGDSDPDNLSASEITTYESVLASLVTETNRLVETSDPEFFDGSHATILKSKLEELQALTPTEGTIDEEGSESSTNDNRAILDLLDDIALAAGAAADTTATLNLMADNVIDQIDRKLKKLRIESSEISVEQAVEAEFEVQRLKTEYATFLQAIEIGFDFASQSADRLVEAMDPDNFSSNTVLSLIV